MGITAGRLNLFGPITIQSLTNAQMRNIETWVEVIVTRLPDLDLNDNMSRAANQVASLTKSRGAIETTEKFQTQLFEVIL